MDKIFAIPSFQILLHCLFIYIIKQQVSTSGIRITESVFWRLQK